MSTTVVVTPKGKTKTRRTRRNRRKKSASSEVEVIKQRVAPTGSKVVEIDRVVSGAGMSGKGSTRTTRRAARRLEQLAITHPESKTQNIKVLKGPIMSLYQKLTADFTPHQHNMLRNYLRCLVDPYTNVFQLGVQARLPDANSIQSAIVRSKKLVPINIVWDGGANQGKFSFAARPIMGSFDNFNWYQDYSIGENGWVTNADDSFTDTNLYVNEFTSTVNQSWPLAYDPNYPFLASSPAQNFTIFGTSTTSYGPDYPLNSGITFATPLGQTGVSNGLLPIQKTPGLNTMVGITGSPAVNTVTVPPGLWFFHATHSFSYTTQIPVPNVLPIAQSCVLTALNYNWITGNDFNPQEGVAFEPNTLDPTWPNGVGYLAASFYIQNTGTRNSIFQYTWTNNGTGSTALLTTMFRGIRQQVENGLYPSVTTFTDEQFNIGILSATQSSNPLGIASKIRPVSMSVWFKPSIAPIAQGGSITMAYVPRGVFESNFLADASNTPPGQLQEFSSLDQIPQNACNFKTQDGAYGWWRPSDPADYKYRDVVDMQNQLNIDEEQYGTIVISGVVPPTPGSTPSSDIVNIGYVEVVRVFELQTASQLLNTMSYVGATSIVDIALQLIDQGGLSLVHENPMHISDILAWGKRIGLGIYNVGRKVNQFSKDLTGMNAIALASKALPLLAL